MTNPQSQNIILDLKRELLAHLEQSVIDCTLIADRAQDPARIELYRGEADRAQHRADDLREEINDLLK